jgi:hypothetical protein
LANRKETAEDNQRFFCITNINKINVCNVVQLIGSHCAKVTASVKQAVNVVERNVGADVTAHPMHNVSKMLLPT